MELVCDYSVNSEGWYECMVFDASITRRCQVKSFKGEHKSGKSAENIGSLCFMNTIVHYVPGGLYKIFPNLKQLRVDNCGLKEITSKDLLGLGNLEKMSLESNDLTCLPDDLFSNTMKLHSCFFDYNNLESLSSRLISLISDCQWRVISLQKNSKIDAIYVNFWNKYFGNFNYSKRKLVNSVRELKSLINSNCASLQNLPFEAKIATKNCKQLWEKKDYSDFMIVVGKKEIRVHKCILVAQSTFFKSFLRYNEDVKRSNRLEIKNCNETDMEEFLQALYTGEVKNEDNALELFCLACTFDVEDLKTAYEGIIIKNLDDQNAVQALDIGNLYGSSEIIDTAFKQISQMYPNDVQSESLKYDPIRVEKIINARSKFREEVEVLNQFE